VSEVAKSAGAETACGRGVVGGRGGRGGEGGGVNGRSGSREPKRSHICAVSCLPASSATYEVASQFASISKMMETVDLSIERTNFLSIIAFDDVITSEPRKCFIVLASEWISVCSKILHLGNIWFVAQSLKV
jgi:hypothetical protein